MSSETDIFTEQNLPFIRGILSTLPPPSYTSVTHFLRTLHCLRLGVPMMYDKYSSSLLSPISETSLDSLERVEIRCRVLWRRNLGKVCNRQGIRRVGLDLRLQEHQGDVNKYVTSVHMKYGKVSPSGNPSLRWKGGDSRVPWEWVVNGTPPMSHYNRLHLLLNLITFLQNIIFYIFRSLSLWLFVTFSLKTL